MWAALTDLGRYPEWNPLFREASGQVAVGNRITLRSVHPANGRLMTVKPKITVADPGAELKWVSSLPGHHERRAPLRAVPGGRRHQARAKRDLPWPPHGGFPGKTFTKAEASFVALNEALKRRAEDS